MKSNIQLKYSNYVAFSHFHGYAVNNPGLNYKNAPEKIDTYHIKNIEDEIEKLELEINYQNLQDKDTIKRWQLYKNRLDKSIGDGE